MTLPAISLWPRRIRELPRDDRGYPIPFVVYIDDKGKAQFTINDDIKMRHAAVADLCGICGKRLLAARWFVGGPISAFHANGCYNDGPLHHECARFALKVCPFLAGGRYTREIGAGKLAKDDSATLLIDQTMIPGQPEVFVAGMTFAAEISLSTGFPRYHPLRPYMKVEYWQHGQRLNARVAEPIVRRIMAAYEESRNDRPSVPPKE